MSHRVLCLLLASALAVGGAAGPVPAGAAAGGPLLVAVAANFGGPARELAARFEAAGGGPVAISTGSSGALFAQIVNGAPFAAFLSADAERPRRLEQEGLGVVGRRFTYAVGRLVLWRPGGLGGAGLEEALAPAGIRHLAIANPETAPYGRAARQALRRLGLWEALGERIVRGESIGQTHQFVAAGAAEIGLVALSQVRDEPTGELLVVPAELHDPIEQQAILLDAADLRAAAFLDFLRGGEGRRVIEAAGYSVPAVAP